MNPRIARLTRRRISLLVCLVLAAFGSGGLHAKAAEIVLEVSARPMHDGRINPMLFGNFMELLDDLVPGMWAEMLNDRGFDGVKRPANWVYYDGAPNVCDREWDKNDNWTYDATDAFNGPRCAKLMSADGRSASLTQAGLAVTKGAMYRFSAYLRTDAADTRIQAILKALLPDGHWMSLASATLPAPSSDWARYTAQLPSRGTTDRAVFELQVAGHGAVWADKLSLMPSDNLDGWRPDVIEAIKAVRPAVVRWGGSVCDPGAYRWKNGIGDRDRRVPFPNRVWGRIDSNDVGIDEFCRFCELVKAQPLVCLSFSDGSKSAADFVEYCNGAPTTEWGAKRAANGRPEPYRVRYWQLGNEISGDDDHYVNACPAFCKAMKRIDPAVLLLASFPSQRLLDKLGKEIAYIGPHHYTPDLAACEADFKKLAEMIRKTPGCGHIRVAVTEWNVSAGGWGLMRGKFLTLETALLNARYLNLLCRYSNLVDIACRSNMTNSLGSGIIATTPVGLLERPSYHVMKLYADHAKPIPLSATGAPDGLDVVACASPARDAVCIFAVNTKNEPVVLALDLTEFGAAFAPTGAETVCDTLDARQPDVMNHWTAKDRVRTTRLQVTTRDLTLPAFSATAIECAQR
jgi:alpha-N-arabinofuranosidase